MHPFRLFRSLALGSLVASAAVLGVSPAESAPTVSATVKTRFAKTKKKVDTARVNTIFTASGGKPQMKTKKGKMVPLDPTSVPATGGGPAPGELSKYQPYYSTISENPVAEQATIVATRVDHTSRQTPVKDQRSRGSCVAFSIAGGMESYLKWKHNIDADVSEEHMFKLFKDSASQNCNNYGFSFPPAKTILDGKKICNESQLPYADPSACVIPAACNSNAAFEVERSLLVPASPSVPGSGFSSRNTKVYEAFLDLGYDVVIGMEVAGTGWHDDDENGVIDVQIDPDGTPADSRGGHALLVVGYDHVAGYFIIKNSWGSDWGRAGYGRFSYDYIQTYAVYGAMVVLEASRKLVVAPVAPQVGTAKPNLPPIGAAR